MNIWELSEKAEYIADKHQRLLAQWQHYGNTLIQGITLSKAKLHHAVGCNPDDDVRFFLFDHFVIHIALAEGFNSHTIEYYVEKRDGSDKILIAQAILDDDGRVDGSISNRNREQVLEHYLEKIRPVYDSLYRAVHDDAPLSLIPLQQKALA
ncbi:formate hydrogenlyase regulator HycA [Enterobacteriaceae bacterium H11S18]|uniref:formate hydrogenlyase regulator HycA n=1 Tax=Enterobacteriaceae TaxID=543 RepID=UPI001928D755|nr:MULTISPECIES: formate hydrogenlyase regulator HycA [Enterobacteriaceae]MCT4704841.1 formate hydrogenlyase regulator HycA [Dryocola clanedunensis]MCT4711991.1 formate hydrogenlyase regulator HycA [Dryocola clanedunensis]